MTTVETTRAEEAIPLSPPVNLRDLGGIRIGETTVRTRFAIRADDLSIITEDDADELVGGGLRAVIDLRSADEVALTGRGALGSRSSVNYHHVPFMSDISQAAEEDVLDQSSFGRMYVQLYNRAAAQIVTSLSIIAHTPGAVAFHCAAGQDRTGVLAAALLLALGADPEAIVTDYTRTGENSTAIRTRIAPLIGPLMSRHGRTLDGSARAAMRTDFSDVPMRALLGELTSRHGDPLSPLRASGLDDALIARLRARGLEPAAA